MIIQFLVCFAANISFAVLFSAPKRQLIFCGLTGSVGWLVYLLCKDCGLGLAGCNLVATLTLTLISRIIAALQKHPVTVYLVAGIFPLVPGAGIYYMSYYFIMNETDQCAKWGMDTLKIAGSIVLGIIFGFALPQKLFNKLHSVKLPSVKNVFRGR